MPLLLEPNQRYPVVLDSDKDKPKELRPVFWAFALSGRETLAKRERVKAVKDDAEIYPLLAEVVVAWDHMIKPDGVAVHCPPTEPEKAEVLKDLLIINEAWELYNKIANNDHLTPDIKKKSD